LGAGINMAALLYWWQTLAPQKRGEQMCSLATPD
jgi:hypothetical protein